MSCKEVVTFWLDMGAPISLLSRGPATTSEGSHVASSPSGEAVRLKIRKTAFDVLLDTREHVPMHRVLAGVLAMSVAVFGLASPAVAEAKPKTPRPSATPT